MASLNKVLLIGNLTRDPELRYIPSGTAVAEFGLAVNREYMDKAGENPDAAAVDPLDLRSHGAYGRAGRASAGRTL